MGNEAATLVEIERTNGALVLTVATEAVNDIPAVARLERELRKHATERPENAWVVDFRNVTFFVTPAINALFDITRSLRARGGNLVLTGLSESVRYIVGLRALDQVVTITPTVPAALAALANGNGKHNGNGHS